MRLVVILLSLMPYVLLASRVDAGSFVIGSHGARIHLDGKWTRKEVIAGLGKDQFLNGNGVRVVFFEVMTPLDSELAIRHLYDKTLTNMKTAATLTVQGETPPTFRKRENGTEVLGYMQVKESGLDVEYAVAVLSQGQGLVYVCMAFALGPKRKSHLMAAVQDVLADLAFPGQDSDWGREIAPQQRTFDFDWGQVRISYRHPLWKPDETVEDAILALESVADLTNVRIYDYDDYDVPELIEALPEYFLEVYPDYAPDAPRARTVGGIDGMTLSGTAKAGQHTVHALVLPVAERRVVELRLASPYDRELTLPLWERWVAGLQIEVFATVVAFPGPLAKPAPVIEEPSPASALWLSHAEWLGTAPEVQARGAVPAGTGFLIYGGGGIQRVGSDGSASWVYSSNSAIVAGTVSLDAGDTLVRFGHALYRLDDDGEFVIAEPLAYARARLEFSLLVTRHSREADVVGHTGLPPAEPERLISITEQGEKLIEICNDTRITWLVPNTDRQAVFVTREPYNLDKTRPQWDGIECFQRGLDGVETPLGKWQVDFVGSAVGGWVVTGRPAGGVYGVYRVAIDTPPELLISGRGFIGVVADAATITVTGRPVSPARGTPGGTAVYRVPLDWARKHGPGTMPFDALRLDEIGQRALARTGTTTETAFATRKSIEAFAAACHEVAVELCGRRLPGDAEQLDDAFDVWLRDSDLVGSVGAAVLSGLLCERFFEIGAVWVPVRPGFRGPPVDSDLKRTTSYASTASPHAIVASTLFDTDGYWRPVSEVTDKLEGRTLLLGFDHSALRAELAEYSDTRLHEMLMDADVAPLVNHFAEHRANRYVRYEVYQHLAAQGRHADVRAVASSFLDIPEPLFLDLRADQAARVALAAAGDVEPLIADLKTSIRRFSRTSVFYELLGAAYRWRSAEGDDRRAKKCYDHVLTLVESGDVADRCRVALEELSKSE